MTGRRLGGAARAGIGLLVAAVFAAGLALAVSDRSFPPASADHQYRTETRNEDGSGTWNTASLGPMTQNAPCERFAPAGYTSCTATWEATWVHYNEWNEYNPNYPPSCLDLQIYETCVPSPAPYGTLTSNSPQRTQCTLPRTGANANCNEGNHADSAPAPGTEGNIIRWLRHWDVRNYTWEATYEEQVLIEHCGPGEHAHGTVCEADHPSVPPCAPGVPDTDTRTYTTHNSSGDNITVSVPGCDSTGTPDCVPGPGQHAHGTVCEADHPSVPPCAPGVVNTQTQSYTTHNGSGQNVQVSVVGCDDPDPDPPPTEEPVNCPSGQIPDGSGGCRDPILACPDGWTQQGTNCVPPSCPPPQVWYGGACGNPQDFTLEAPEGLTAECAYDAVTDSMRVRYSWAPVPGAAGYHLYGTVHRATNNGEMETAYRGRSLVLYQGSDTSAFPTGFGDQWRLRVRQYVDPIPGVSVTQGPLSGQVTGYCPPPAPQNLAVVCGWAHHWFPSYIQPSYWTMAVGVSYDAHGPTTAYQADGTAVFSYGVNRGLLTLADLGIPPDPIDIAVYLRGSSDWVHDDRDLAEGSEVSVRLRRSVHGMLSEQSAEASATCPIAVERVFAQCAFGRLDVRWPPLPGPSTVTLVTEEDHGYFTTVDLSLYGLGTVQIWTSVWQEAGTAEHMMAGGAGSLDVAVAGDDTKPRRVTVQVADDNNRTFTREPVNPQSGPETWFHRATTSPGGPGTGRSIAACADTVTGLAVDCPAPHATVTVSWDAYTAGTVLRYEAEEDGGTLADYSGTATSFDRASPVGDVYRWRARAILDDGAGGETETPWSPWFEHDCPPAAPTGLAAACAATTVTGPPITIDLGIYGIVTIPGASVDGWGVDGTWDADSRARTYQSQHDRSDGTADMGSPTVSGTSSSDRMADVFAPQTPGPAGGQVRIRALGNSGTISEWGPWTAYQCVPDNIAAECPAPHSTVTVSWDAYTGAAVLRYEAEEDGATLASHTGTATSFTRSSATADAYRWRIRMILDDGAGGETEGPWSPWHEHECPPVQPTGLTVACADTTIQNPPQRIWIDGLGYIDLPGGQSPAWDIDGTWDADTRAVRYESQREEDPLPSPLSVSGATLRTDRATTDNSAGRIRIRALGNNSVASEWSDWADYECLPIPTGLIVDCTAGTTLTATWDSDPNAAAYEAEEDGADMTPYSGTANTFTRTATMGGTYRWRVRAQINSIWTQWTDWAETVCGVPPTGLRVACTAGGTLSAAVLSASWDPVSWATGYEAEEDGGGLAAYAGSAVSFTRTTAAANTEYRWRVRATGTGGTVSPWSGWAADTCPPAAPAGLSVQCGPAPLSRTLTVDWTAPAGARDYQVEASSASAAFTAYYGTATSIGRIGAWGATYELRVRAWSVAGGWGNWAAYDSATCPPSPAPSTAPAVTGGDPAGGTDPAGNGCYYGAIRSGWAGAIGDGVAWVDPPEHRGPRVMISWTWDSDPDGDGVHEPLTRFDVRGGWPDSNGWQITSDIPNNSGTAWMWPANWSGPALNHPNYPNAPQGDHTDIQVRAANGSGTGPWSPPFEALCRLGVG